MTDGYDGFPHVWGIKDIFEKDSGGGSAIWDLNVHVPLSNCMEDVFVSSANGTRGDGVEIDEAMPEGCHVS